MNDPIRLPILYAEDDQDNWLLMHLAHLESVVKHPIVFVSDGREVIEYLCGEGRYANAPKPGIILLDLNMPGLDGIDTLRWVKGQPAFRTIPVVVLTTSTSDKDIAETYAAGASTYITKPASAAGLVGVLDAIGRYWFGVATLPASGAP
jgi:two-component system, response regulator